MGQEIIPLEVIEEEDRLEAERLDEANADREKAEKRQAWIRDVGAPALARSPLLAGCPEEFLAAVAGHLEEVTFAAGDTIATTGEASDSMLLLVEGEAELESKVGEPIGRLRRRGAIGEAEALGLFGQRTVSMRAGTDCRILPVTREAIQDALAGEHGELVREGFGALTESRAAQVEDGRPLCGLCSSARVQDPSVKAVALQAERMPLEAGELWEPLPDSDPCGPRIGIFLGGRAVIEIAATGQEVLPVTSGMVVCEGLLVEFGARIKATSSDCEAYRVKVFDLIAASKLSEKAPDWFYQFRVAERDSSKKLRARLTNARGVTEGKKSHPTDSCIQEYAERRKESIQRAQDNRREKNEILLGGKGSLPQLPLLPPESFGTTSFRSWDRVPVKASVFPKLKVKARGALPKTMLDAYPVAHQAALAANRLPRMHSEPQLRTMETDRRADSRRRHRMEMVTEMRF